MRCTIFGLADVVQRCGWDLEEQMSFDIGIFRDLW